VAAYLDGESFRLNRKILKWQEIRGGAPLGEDEFAGVGFTAAELPEVRKLVAVKAGSTFNLAANESALFREIDADAPASAGAASAVYRRVLLQRHRAYLENGLKAIAPYDRAKGKHVSPGQELTIATNAMTLLKEKIPEYHAALLEFPHEGVADIDNSFFWFKQIMDGRPVFLLSHQMSYVRANYAIIIERQFYVSNSYNSLQMILGCFPYEGGTVVMYANHTFTDQITGFASGMKRSIGRGRLMDTVKKHFERLRTALEAGG